MNLSKIKIICYFAFFCLFLISSKAADSSANTVLIDEVFAKSKWSGHLPKDWKSGNRTQIELVKKDQSGFLRIQNNDLKKVISLSRVINLPEKIKKYTVTVKFRCKNLVKGKKKYNNARIILNFRDNQRKMCGNGSSPQLSKDSDWRVITRQILVPRNATTLTVILCLFNATGVFDIEYIKINKVKVQKETAQALVKKITSCREEIILNGLWKFQPEGATGEGLIYVPGIWNRVNMNGIGSFAKKDPSWKGINFDKLATGIYKRNVNIPKSWGNRQVVLNLDRLSTSGEIFLSDKKVGIITWPQQELKISHNLIDWGRNQELKIVVTAKDIAKNISQLMNPNFLVTLTQKLNGKGIIGDAFLTCRPQNYLDGVFIKTSVKNKTLTLDVELNDIKKKDTINFTAVVKTLSGKVEKIFKATKTILPGKRKITLSWKWDNPKLWDVKQPNLYNLILSARSSSLNDEILERFGFREIEIKGKDFYLNGGKIRFRSVATYDTRYIGGVKGAIENNISGYLWAGFNLFNVGPRNLIKSGNINFSPLWAKAADEKGMLVIYPSFYDGRLDFLKIISSQEAYSQWLKLQTREWKKVRNSPSIVIFIVGIACHYAHRDDQNPRRIGQSKAFAGNEIWEKKAKTGFKLIKSVQKIDSTRIISNHHGSSVGEIYSCNTYLDFIPLQEREEWLSEWSKKGDMPYAAWEFGTPFESSFVRGRGGYLQAATSEPLVTEFTAALLGDKVYKDESKEYRDGIPKFFIKGQKYRNMLYLSSTEQNFREIQQLFITKTWRSWRTWGINGGMTPWMNAYGWTRFKYPVGNKTFDEYRIGERGAQLKSIRNHFYQGMKYWKINSSGKALLAVNQPVMVWIAGKKGTFTEKEHNFYSGQILQKQIVIINDKRKALDINIKWQISSSGKTTDGAFTARLAPGAIQKIPIQLKLPTVSKSSTGKINLKYKFDGKSGTDTFAFKIFPRLSLLQKNLSNCLIWDPVGETKKLYKNLGLKIREWDKNAKGKVLLIGAKAFTAKKIPNGFEQSFFNHLANGGNIVIFGQKPDWYRQKGLRINRHVLRRVFPVASTLSHPIIKNLNHNDLRDWQGAGELVAKEQYTQIDDSKRYWGWHWTNRGSVTSSAIEKPHFSAWSSILECGFDLAYSPLMEMHYAKGNIISCTLDLERKTSDPVSNLLAERILNYASSTQVNTRSIRTFAIGEKRVFETLNLLGVIYKKTSQLPQGDALVIIGPKARISFEKCNEFINRGGRIIWLTPSRIFNGQVVKGKYSKVTAIPSDPAFAGLSLSDLHLRSSIKFNKIASLENGHIAANGMLGTRRKGNGLELFIQLLPSDLPAEQKTYFRFSRWRLSRMLAQLLANNGAKFSADKKIIRGIFKGSVETDIKISGNWKYKVEKLYPQAPNSNHPTRDKGNTGYSEGWASRSFNDTSWKTITMPGYFQESRKHDGAFWIRKVVNIPRNWNGKNLTIYLGCIADCDTTYFNGRKIGEVTASTKWYWGVERKYTIPAELVKPGRNVIAVRIFDRHNASGIAGSLTPMYIGPQSTIQKCQYYYPDYRGDFRFGDDPARYHRW